MWYSWTLAWVTLVTVHMKSCHALCVCVCVRVCACVCVCWTRVAYLNISDSSSVCPSGTQEFEHGSVRAPGIQEPSDAICVSITYPTTHSNSQICGHVAAYQKGSPSAFDNAIDDIDQICVNGISSTRGSPRQHVWTYAVTVTEPEIHVGGFTCPCSTGSTQQPPSFVANDFTVSLEILTPVIA